jgi:hypothetical protein
MKYGRIRGNKREVTIGTAHTDTVNSLNETLTHSLTQSRDHPFGKSDKYHKQIRGTLVVCLFVYLSNTMNGLFVCETWLFIDTNVTDNDRVR